MTEELKTLTFTSHELYLLESAINMKIDACRFEAQHTQVPTREQAWMDYVRDYEDLLSQIEGSK